MEHESRLAPGRIPLAEHRRSLRELMSAVLDSPNAPGVETVGLEGARNRTLARNVSSPVNVPPVANSQMDGFALNVASLACTPDGASITLPLGHIIAAGEEPSALEPGTARPIMTGAPIPAGANAVIPVEATDIQRFSQLTNEGSDATRQPSDLTFTIAPEHRTEGRFVRHAGSDTDRGDVVARAGQRLTPRLIGHLASVGVAEVEVRERLRAVVVSTGSELRDPGEAAVEEWKIFDANSVLMSSALGEAGIELCARLRVTDDPKSLLAEVLRACENTQAQIVVSTGGVSAGAVEPIRQAAEMSGSPLRLAFDKVAMQPGGPQGLGVLATPHGDVAWIALPGNPVSGFVSLELFVREALGAPPRPRMSLPVRTQTGEPEPSPEGLVQVRRARLNTDSTVKLVGGPSSHLLGALALSDALVLIPPEVTRVADGDIHEVMILR
ncbi:molybdopterin molybdotransferase MoeA [Dermabacter sp. p3-SID358]|uniref:molybdopterin molybdotransferase MoeA n=1 Tax=Dermabacter sp. p3-SID358 TaxID=2916114 RepID=UPI0021A48C9A|nr:gephyrin-like molybdotransferase Glp [Dermabacter sp. p3-SID358]MCT1866826.1 molybdopterin molybdotransferase MoeA [Dermabacter sp. p3-SID358]